MSRFRFSLVLAMLLLCSSTASAQQFTCNNWSLLTIGGTVTTTQMVPAQTGLRVGVCGYALFWSAVGNFTLSTGTGTNCGTNNAAMSPSIPLAAGASVINRSDFVGERTAQGNALCYAATGTGAAIVYWTQFQ